MKKNIIAAIVAGIVVVSPGMVDATNCKKCTTTTTSTTVTTTTTTTTTTSTVPETTTTTVAPTTTTSTPEISTTTTIRPPFEIDDVGPDAGTPEAENAHPKPIVFTG